MFLNCSILVFARLIKTVQKGGIYMNRDALWLVEYIPNRELYRISRFAEPDQTIAYEDYWSDAVKAIKGNYGIDGLIIFVRKYDGTVDYYCEADYV